MANRDIRRHRGRAALVVAMIGLPVLLLVAGATFQATADVSAPESIPAVMGQAQAALQVVESGPVVQSPFGDYLVEPNSPDTRDGRPATASALAALLRADAVTPVQHSYVRVDLGGRKVGATVLGLDGRLAVTRGKVSLISGRWPEAVGEALATPSGIEKGLPATGTIRLTMADGPTRGTAYRIVGVGEGSVGGVTPQTSPALVVAFPDPDTPASAWLVERQHPVTWSEVQRLNASGIAVASRAVFLEPPPTGDLREDVAQYVEGDNRDLLLVGSIVSIGLFVEAALLAGPAFAVSAARSRRSLALAACNGATVSQVRRVILAQAVLLGVRSALVGGAVGLALAWVGPTLVRRFRPSTGLGPFEVPWLTVTAIVGCAVLASLVAALVPARGLVRLDVVAALRGSYTPDPRHRGLPLWGVGLVGLGGAMTVGGALANRSGRLGATTLVTLIGTGGIVLVLGAVMVLPALLGLVSRLTSSAPLSVRMATRDAARQRGRAVSATAAIMAAAASMSAGAFALDSDAVQGARDHQMAAPLGAGLLTTAGTTTTADVEAMVHRVASELIVSPIRALATREVDSSAIDADQAGIPPGAKLTLVAAVVRGCSPTEALRSVGNPEGRCASLSSAPASVGQEVLTADADFLVRRLALDAQQARTLRAGGVVVGDSPPVGDQVGAGPAEGASRAPNTTRVEVVDGSVVFAVGSGRLGAEGSPVVGGEPRTVKVPAVAVPADRFRAVTTDVNVSALVASSTVRRLGWPTAPRQLAVDGPGGRPITDAEEQAMEQARSDDVMLVVERGYQRSDALAIAVAFGVISVLILVSTLTATALGQAENAPFLGTLAAVGATRGTRRRMAGAQAASSAFLGALVGALIGLVPGAALAIPLTSRDGSGSPVYALPWSTLAGLVLIVPVLAAALAAAGIRRAPVVTRRPT